MSTEPPGQQLWRPSPKQIIIGLIGATVVIAGLLLTLPKDETPPLRATSVSRPSDSTTTTGASNGVGAAAPSTARAPETPSAVGTPTSPAAVASVSKPAEGRYVYRTTTESNEERADEERSWIVTYRDKDTVQKTSASGREGEANRESQTFTEQWTATAVTQTALQFPAREGESEGRRCTMEPPLLDLPLPLEIGTRWESAANCGEGKERMTFESAGQVVRIERIAVAGVEVDTFVIDHVSGRGQRGLVWFATEGTEWFSPSLGMVIRRNTVSRETETGTSFRQDITSELLAWPGGAPA